MMIGYRMQEATIEEMAADDPFGGEGIFLRLEATAEVILASLEHVFRRIVPAVAWPMRGAWVLPSGMGMLPAEVRACWDNRSA